MLDTVAVRVADGALRPVINTTAKASRRIVLSVAPDNQDEIMLELYRGAGKEVFDQQLLDVILIEYIPPHHQMDIDILLSLSVDDAGQLNVRISVEGTNISLGCTYNLWQKTPLPDLRTYITRSNAAVAEPALVDDTQAASPIDENFVLGIDPHISYNKEDIRKEDRARAAKKIKTGIKISSFLLYLVIILGGLLLLAFIVYLSIETPPLPPLEA